MAVSRVRLLCSSRSVRSPECKARCSYQRTVVYCQSFCLACCLSKNLQGGIHRASASMYVGPCSSRHCWVSCFLKDSEHPQALSVDMDSSVNYWGLVRSAKLQDCDSHRWEGCLWSCYANCLRSCWSRSCCLAADLLEVEFVVDCSQPKTCRYPQVLVDHPVWLG